MLGRQFTALVVANARYWPTVHPVVQRELRRWRMLAERIPDERRRQLALGKLDAAGSHALITATLATLAPRRNRELATVAMVALEVMYDYLDALTEDGVDLDTGRELYSAIASPFGTTAPPDDEYVRALSATCSVCVRSLPAFAAIAPPAAFIAERCAEAQVRSHEAPGDPDQLAIWAAANAIPGLLWWETAAGYAASILAVHALIALGAHPSAEAAQATAVADGYLLACAFTTMLDSLVDHERDIAQGEHSYVAYYDRAVVAERLALLALLATAAMLDLPDGAHHAMTVAGIGAYYLSDPARGPHAREVAPVLQQTLGPLVLASLAVFRTWRASSRLRH